MEMPEKEAHGYISNASDLWTTLEREIKSTAPKPCVILRGREIPVKPPQYEEEEFHGKITRSKAQQLLSQATDGCYLVRESESAPGNNVLTIRFKDTSIKHFTLSYVDGRHVVGDKAFKKLSDLVNCILESYHLNTYVDDFNAIHEHRRSVKDTSTERNQPAKITTYSRMQEKVSAKSSKNDYEDLRNVFERNNNSIMDNDEKEKTIINQVPKASIIACEQNIPWIRPSHYGKEFHGPISREEADDLVSKYPDGHYLVRESQRDPGSYILAFRFGGVSKQFKLYYDGLYYVGKRRFRTLNDLVNDGLTTLYLETCTELLHKQLNESYATTTDEIPSSSPNVHEEDYEDYIFSDQDGIDKNDDENDENDGKVPLEILVQGPLGLHAYHKALEDGKTTVKRVPIMFIGQGQAGKTSLKKSLKGEKFDPDEKGTTGIETDPSFCKVSTEVWKLGEKTQEEGLNPLPFSYEHCTAQYILDNLKGEKQKRESEHLTVCDTLLTVQEEPGTADVSEVPVAASEPDASETLQSEPQVPKEVTELIEKLLQVDGNEKDSEGIYSVLWDFGGQSVYYVTHSVFLTVTAIYFLVYNLSWGPDEVAKRQVKQGVFNTVQDGFCDRTNRDYLNIWMSSVSGLVSQDEVTQEAATCEMLSERLPPVFLVCTHADEPYKGKDPEEIARELFTSLKAKSYGKHLLDYFCVDNTKSGGGEECPSVTRLRKVVHDVVKQLPQMKQVLPIKWLKYEKALQGMLQDDWKWISRDEAWRIAHEECGISNEEQFEALLTFLHDQRILIHFGDTRELRKIVILDPQWLIDIFKKIIAIKPTEKKGRKFEELWLKLETTGILDERLLQHVWGPLFDNEETSSSLVALMEKFCLLCPWPSSATSKALNEYLVPSMLLFPPKEDINQLIASSGIPSLFIKFTSGQVPPGLFPRLVLMVFQWCTKKWLSQLQPHLHQNFARFFTHPSEGCSIILLCRSSSIEVVVHKKICTFEVSTISPSGMSLYSESNYDNFQITVAQSVCRQLGLILECMRREFHWLKNMAYEMSVCCPVCCTREVAGHCRSHNVHRCKEEECLHFWSESQLRNCQEPVVCTRSAVADDYTVPVKRVGIWFRSMNEQRALHRRDAKALYFRTVSEDDDEQAIALPEEVLEAIQLQNPDANDVVARLQKRLLLEQSSLEEPNPEAKRQIRCLCFRANIGNRLDVVKKLREIAPAGTTGPLLPEACDVINIPIRVRQELTINLCGRDEWKLFTEKLGLTPAEILYLDKRVMNPCDAALAHSRNQGYIHSVGELYDALADSELPVLADLL